MSDTKQLYAAFIIILNKFFSKVWLMLVTPGRVINNNYFYEEI
jgi:hypothetical protein